MSEPRVWPIVTGALLAVIVAGAVAGFVVWKYSPRNPGGTPQDRTVIVAVALPDLDGVVTPRALSVYALSGGRLTTQSADPNATATVPGTSANKLSDAYLYGGGDLLAKSYGALKGSAAPDWVVVDQNALSALMGDRGLAITLPEPVDVYDGTALYSFNSGVNSITQADLPRLMDGVNFLSERDQTDIRDQLGAQVLTNLARSSASLQAGVKTNMQPADFEQWLETVSMETSSPPSP